MSLNHRTISVQLVKITGSTRDATQTAGTIPTGSHQGNDRVIVWPAIGSVDTVVRPNRIPTHSVSCGAGSN
jgi:hypothetical protein